MFAEANGVIVETSRLFQLLQHCEDRFVTAEQARFLHRQARGRFDLGRPRGIALAYLGSLESDRGGLAMDGIGGRGSTGPDPVAQVRPCRGGVASR